MSLQDLADVNRRLKSVRSRLKRRCADALPEEEVPAPFARQALLIFIWSLNSFAIAAFYLKARAFPNLEDVQVEDMVTNLVSSCPRDVLARWSIQPPHRDVYKACVFIIGYRLWKWLEEQNIVKGVAPPRRLFVREALAFIPEGLPEAVEQRLRRPLVGSDRAQRKFVQRFRATWKARIGSLPVCSLLPVDALQEKARGENNAPLVPSLGLKHDFKTGYNFGFRNGVSF